jgi:hypothetical protein
MGILAMNDETIIKALRVDIADLKYRCHSLELAVLKSTLISLKVCYALGKTDGTERNILFKDVQDLVNEISMLINAQDPGADDE